MVSAVLVPIKVAVQLPVATEALQQGLERGDFANLEPVRLSDGVFPAATAAQIVLADVAHCLERSLAGYQLPADRWEALFNELEQLTVLPQCRGEPAREV